MLSWLVKIESYGWTTYLGGKGVKFEDGESVASQTSPFSETPTSMMTLRERQLRREKAQMVLADKLWGKGTSDLFNPPPKAEA